MSCAPIKGVFFFGWGWMWLSACELHKDIRESIKDHERRIGSLEQSNAEFAVRLENLCKKLDELTGWIKALVVAIVTTGVGFFVWYIQSLPR
jgi:hypothetical protein